MPLVKNMDPHELPSQPDLTGLRSGQKGVFKRHIESWSSRRYFEPKHLVELISLIAELKLAILTSLC